MSGWIFLLVFVALLTGIGFGFRALKRRLGAAAETMSSLLLEGIPTTAHIDATEKRRMSRGQFEYFVTYVFRARDDSEFKKELRVSATHFDDYSKGQAIEIVYLPRDPSISATREVVDKARAARPG